MASFFCLNASTTEIERNSVLRSFAWLAWHTGTLPRDLCGFVREVIFRQDFSDAIGLMLGGFLSPVQMREIGRRMRGTFQCSTMRKRGQMMRALVEACGMLRVMLRRRRSGDVEATLREMEEVMEWYACQSVLDGCLFGVVDSFFVEYLRMQVKVRGITKRLFFPREDTVKLLTLTNNLIAIDGISMFIKE